MKCKLCKRIKADKKNSHIIPKFFKKGLFESKDKIRGYIIQTHRPLGKHKVVQDIPKEDYIFCASCESRLSTLETYFANNLFNKLHKSSSKFKVKANYKTKIKYTKEIDANLINLLIQSILWRQHISSHKSFEYFNIDQKDANTIRLQLNKIISIKKKDMLINMDKHKPKFKFFPYLMWTHTKKNRDDNFILGIPDQTEKYFLVLNSLRIHICSSGSCFSKVKKGLNIDDSRVSFLLVNKKDWREESLNIISQGMKSTWDI